MSSENAGSAANSGATSNRPQPPQKKNPELSEADFIADQQVKAKAAMDRTVSDMKLALTNAFKDNAHITEWMGAYPWVSLGAGALAGFLAASALTPAREESFKERLRSLIEETKVKEVPDKEKEKGTEKAAKAAVSAEKPSTMEKITSGIFDIVKTALVSTLSGAVAGKVAEDDKSGNGQSANQSTTA